MKLKFMLILFLLATSGLAGSLPAQQKKRPVFISISAAPEYTIDRSEFDFDLFGSNIELRRVKNDGWGFRGQVGIGWQKNRLLCLGLGLQYSLRNMGKSGYQYIAPNREHYNVYHIWREHNLSCFMNILLDNKDKKVTPYLRAGVPVGVNFAGYRRFMSSYHYSYVNIANGSNDYRPYSKYLMVIAGINVATGVAAQFGSMRGRFGPYLDLSTGGGGDTPFGRVQVGLEADFDILKFKRG